ncbi:kinase-like protein [Favolaschia claudopus]|uniref:Kinase-like protein n=1 Tax=Favolaschia claudopus TaxID=2862362 RepID=A0AAW0DSN8_9AGAR
MKKLFGSGRQKPQAGPLQRPIPQQHTPIYLQAAAPVQFSVNEGRGAFDQTVILKSLLTFVVNACDHISLVGRNAHEVAHLRQVLDGYLASTASDDVVHAIIQSLEIRKIVSKLGLAAHPNLRAAQRSDSERIATLLAASFKSEDDKNAILNLSGDSAQSFLDVIQESLDKGLLLDAEQSRVARKMIRKLSESCDSLPSSLFIPNGVHACDQYPTFGGGFGDIYRAIIDGKPVALKRTRHFLRGSDLRRIHLKFCREALIWKELQHPYILPLVGIDRDSFPNSLCMVSPWMEQGTAINYLKEHGHDTVDKLLHEIACGLEYLHSRNIIHGDLKGANILIQGNGTACLADFGLSNFSDVTTSMSTNRGGSVYWMAPELLDPDQFESELTRTPATDVYAFGCVCFELYTGRPPFANLLDGVAAFKIIKGERAVRPSGLPAMSDLFWHHVTLYWAQNPTTRPTTRQIVQYMWLHQFPSSQSRAGEDTSKIDYFLGESIGKGSHARVYLCLNKGNGELIAVKRVQTPQTASGRADLRWLERVRALKVASETLKDLMHPNIVQYLGFEEAPENLNIFLEYVDGGSIASCLQRHGRFNQNVTKWVAEQILMGLAYLHSTGILHRDIKGDNILVGRLSGVCKIAGFGTSKRQQDLEGQAHREMAGTAFWMAPEVLGANARRGYDFKIDIWSAGCVVLEMWSGERPWVGHEWIPVLLQLFTKPQAPPIPDDIRASLSDFALDFRDECFAINPQARPGAALLLEHPYLQRTPGWSFHISQVEGSSGSIGS